MSKLHLYSLINPSDSITFEAQSRGVAAAAILTISPMYGAYHLDGPSGIDGEMNIPIIGSSEWFEKEFGIAPVRFLQTNQARVAQALESFVLGDEGDRKIYLLALRLIPQANREEFQKTWEDLKRSSMNDICAIAKERAKTLRDLHNAFSKA